MMALGNGNTPTRGVTQEKAPVVNGTNIESLPRTGKQVNNQFFFVIKRLIVKKRMVTKKYHNVHSWFKKTHRVWCNLNVQCNLKRKIM